MYLTDIMFDRILNSTQLNSTQLNSTQLNSTQLNSTSNNCLWTNLYKFTHRAKRTVPKSLGPVLLAFLL